MGPADDVLSVSKMGMVCILASAILIVMIPLGYTARHWYTEAENTRGQSGYMQSLADSYVMERKKEVSGDDIISFILKNDSRFDYSVTRGNTTYAITKARAEKLYLAGGEANIWSEEYLLNNVFTDGGVHDMYTVVPVYGNDEAFMYKFYQKEAED